MSSKQKSRSKTKKQKEEQAAAADQVDLGTEVEEEEEDHHKSIEVLREHKVKPSQIKTLKERGIRTMAALAMTPKRKLLQLPGFSEKSVELVTNIGMLVVVM